MGEPIGRPCPYGYGAITLCGPVFNPVRLEHGFVTPARRAGAGTGLPTTPRAQPPTGITRPWFGLVRFRSPLLTEYPFLQVLRCFTSLRTPRPKTVPAHDGRRVSPFGNPRIKARLAAPRGLSQPPTSFIGPVCQGIHHTPLQATHTPVRDPQAPNQQIPRRQIITSEMITKRSTNNTKNEVRSKNTAKETRTTCPFARVHYPVLKPPRTRPATTRTPPGDAPQSRDDGRHTGTTPWVAIREPKSMPAPLQSPMISSTPARPGRTPAATAGTGAGKATRQWPKESP